MVYRVLSLDGGGPWALIQAKALARLYPGKTGRQILGEFDLAIANSGGSITLAGLIKDLTPDAITALFLDAGSRNRIFVPIDDPIAAIAGLGPKWSTAGKRAGLAAIIDQDLATPLSPAPLTSLPAIIEAQTRQPVSLVIVGYDIDRNRETFFRSGPSNVSNEPVPFVPSLVDAVNASSNAPVNYFDQPAVARNVNAPDDVRRFWDGAIGGYNNPVLAGVIEARSNWGADVVALSIGTGTVWQPVGTAPPGVDPSLFQPAADLDLLDAIKQLATAPLNDPPDAATLFAHILLGPPASGVSRLVRLNPMIQPVSQAGGWILPPGYSRLRADGDTVQAFRDMVAMPMDAVAPEQISEISAFADAWLADDIPNQPIQMEPVTGDCLTGERSFSTAAAAWAVLAPARL